VILETGLIPTPELKITASILAAEAGAAFVKTCTGFAAGGGATKEDVSLMYRAVKYKGGVKIKASGGVRSFDACRAMFVAGAERIGTYVFPFLTKSHPHTLLPSRSSGTSLLDNATAAPGAY